LAKGNQKMGTPANPATAYSNAVTNVATLKELYSDDAWVMKDLVFNRNPGLALIDKDESEAGLGGNTSLFQFFLTLALDVQQILAMPKPTKARPSLRNLTSLEFRTILLPP
jgi:hypothetical protein